MKQNKLIVQETLISIRQHEKEDFISLTDIARYKDSDRSDYILQNWMRNRETIEFLGLWEKINNENFNSIEFDGIRNKSGINSFILTPKQWINSTNAIGTLSKAGRYGGTFAHKDIAFEFASWISAEFKLFLIKEFQRLTNEEIENKSLEWNLSRSLSKINYKIHIDAILNDRAIKVFNHGNMSRDFTYVSDLINDFGYKPDTNLEVGIKRFVKWYREFYGAKE